MNFRKIIKEEVKKVLSEDYSEEAQYEPNVRQGAVPNEIEYELVWAEGGGFAFFKDMAGNIFVSNVDSIEKSDLEPYADRDETFLGRDEDGEPLVDHGDWDVSNDAIESYINDKGATIGVGSEDLENGEYDLVMLDDEVRQWLMGISEYMDERYKQQFIDMVSGNVNESGVTDNVVNQETMDTPTGTIYTMGESKK